MYIFMFLIFVDFPSPLASLARAPEGLLCRTNIFLWIFSAHPVTLLILVVSVPQGGGSPTPGPTAWDSRLLLDCDPDPQP